MHVCGQALAGAKIARSEVLPENPGGPVGPDHPLDASIEGLRPDPGLRGEARPRKGEASGVLELADDGLEQPRPLQAEARRTKLVQRALQRFAHVTSARAKISMRRLRGGCWLRSQPKRFIGRSCASPSARGIAPLAGSGLVSVPNPRLHQDVTWPAPAVTLRPE